LSPIIQNYQKRALSDTDENKNTYSDKTGRPRFGYLGRSSQHCQQYLRKCRRVPSHRCPNATKTKDSSSRAPPMLSATSSGCTHFLNIMDGMRSASSTETSVLGCWSVFAPAPPPPRPSAGSGGRGDSTPEGGGGLWAREGI
jgi:hypothetical protein